MFVLTHASDLIQDVDPGCDYFSIYIDTITKKVLRALSSTYACAGSCFDASRIAHLVFMIMSGVVSIVCCRHVQASIGLA